MYLFHMSYNLLDVSMYFHRCLEWSMIHRISLREILHDTPIFDGKNMVSGEDFLWNQFLEPGFSNYFSIWNPLKSHFSWLNQIPCLKPLSQAHDILIISSSAWRWAQDVTFHARMLADNKTWLADQTIIITCSFTPGGNRSAELFCFVVVFGEEDILGMMRLG